MKSKCPKYLYHCSSKENRQSILENGLVGGHGGAWCIYLSEEPKSWKQEEMDLWEILTDGLKLNEFTIVDEKLDEVLYWGKINGKITIPKENVKLCKESK